jgi:nucleoside-diphosphate-sugar epimerase
LHIFITGATGFIGGHIARKLMAQGHHVTALVRDPDRARDLADLGIQLSIGDIGAKDSMRPAMTGADAVYHLAGWYKIGVNDPHTAHAVNVTGTRNVLELMAELGIAKGVYTSTLAANGDTAGTVADEAGLFQGRPMSVYDRTKRIAHRDVAEPMMRDGLPLVVVLPGVVYGPGDNSDSGEAVLDYLAGDLPAVPTGTAVCWAHVDDVADAHILAMERGRPGQDYIIAGPCHTFIEMFDVAASVCGVPAPKIHVPGRALQMLAWPARLLEKGVPLPARYTFEGLQVQGGTTYLGSNTKAADELGYRPRDLETGLRQALPSYIAELEKEGRKLAAAGRS